MLKRGLQVILALLLAGTAWLNVDYWRDPLYWRRWWDTVTHLEPAHMNFSPTVAVQSDRTSFLPRAAAEESSIEPAALRAAEAYAAQFDSFSLIVVHRGRVQAEWYGEGWRRDKQTQSQSMMKTLTAMMVGLAIADGYIESVNDPVSRYLPEWQDDSRGEITLENLLQMSTGLAQYRFTLNPFAQDSSFRFLNSSDRIPVLLSTELEWPPGSRFDYNDVAAALAGIIVERAAGRPYANYFRDRLWNPLGGQYAELWLDREGGSAMTACCLLASSLDWAKLGALMKDGGRFNGQQILPAAWVEAMLQPSAQFAGYGYFTWLGAGMGEEALEVSSAAFQSEPFASDDLFMFMGYGGQRTYVSRVHDLVIVRLGPFAGMQPLKDGWDNARLPNLLVRGIRDEGSR